MPKFRQPKTLTVFHHKRALAGLDTAEQVLQVLSAVEVTQVGRRRYEAYSPAFEYASYRKTADQARKRLEKVLRAVVRERFDDGYLNMVFDEEWGEFESELEGYEHMASGFHQKFSNTIAFYLKKS